MFKKIKKRSDEDTKEIVRKLLDVHNIDTVYKDIYLHRARVFFSDILPYDRYHDLVLDRSLISKLQNKISIAMEKSDWNSVKELAERVRKIKERSDDNHSMLDLGKEIWTHFDGYEISKKGKLSAIAGGDSRFGGIYDLISLGREYSADHLIVRFAVVQRERMLIR